MTVLSNEDILKELGFNIYIYPFRKKNLKGASYNLTASKLAWDLQTKESIYDADKNKLIIPKQTTALIETLESIWVSWSIAGTYHSKVALVSDGLSHVGTTLDPQYRGSSLIAIHNHSQKDYEITPGEENPKTEEEMGETFATLKFHYLNTPASIEPSGNHPGRPDMLDGYTKSHSEKLWLEEGFRISPDVLRAKLSDSPDYKSILDERQEQEAALTKRTEEERRLLDKKANIQKKRKSLSWLILGSFALIVFPIIVAGFLSSFKDKLSGKGWYDPAVNTSYTVAAVAFAGTLTFAFQLLQTSSDE